MIVVYHPMTLSSPMWGTWALLKVSRTLPTQELASEYGEVP